MKSKYHILGVRNTFGQRNAVVTGIFWDNERQRIAVSIVYEDGMADWIPATELEGLGNPNRVGFAYILRHKHT